MSRFKRQHSILSDTDLTEDDLYTITEAATILNRTPWAIVDRLNKGSLTTIIDIEAPERQGRRRLLKAEVNALAATSGTSPT